MVVPAPGSPSGRSCRWFLLDCADSVAVIGEGPGIRPVGDLFEAVVGTEGLGTFGAGFIARGHAAGVVVGESVGILEAVLDCHDRMRLGGGVDTHYLFTDWYIQGSYFIRTAIIFVKGNIYFTFPYQNSLRRSDHSAVLNGFLLEDWSKPE